MRREIRLRVVTRAQGGQFRIRDFATAAPLLRMHTQIGVDDCSTDLTLRGLPVFRGLVGPMPDDYHVARYETPEVFETMTRNWMLTVDRRQRQRPRLAMNTPAASI